MLSDRAKKFLVASVANEISGIAVKFEDAVHSWCRKKMSEFTYYQELNELDWTNRGETGLEGGVERQEGLKIVPYSPFILLGHGTYFTSSETEAELMFQELTFNKLEMNFGREDGPMRRRKVNRWKPLHIVHCRERS